MTTLFERINTSAVVLDPAILSDLPIGVHPFTAAVTEFFHGKFTGAQITAALNLVGDQVTDATRVKNLILDAPNKEAFLRDFKNACYLSEVGLAYTVEANWWTRLEEIVTDQGGTVS